MEKELIKKFKKNMNTGVILTGRIALIQPAKTIEDEDSVIINYDGTKIVIKRSEFDIGESKRSLVPYSAKNVKFVIIDIDEENSVVYASRRIVKELKRDTLIEEMNRTEDVVYDAKVIKLLIFGAYLSIKGTKVTLKNQDFADDFTVVSDVCKVGDTIKVKKAKISSSCKIYVQAETKYCDPSPLNYDSFKMNDVVFGIVKTVKTWGSYICIAPKLDVLVPPAEYLEVPVQEGMKVSIKITDKIDEEQRVRGRILRIISDEDFAYED